MLVSTCMCAYVCVCISSYKTTVLGHVTLSLQQKTKKSLVESSQQVRSGLLTMLRQTLHFFNNILFQTHNASNIQQKFTDLVSLHAQTLITKIPFWKHPSVAIAVNVTGLTRSSCHIKMFLNRVARRWLWYSEDKERCVCHSDSAFRCRRSFSPL